jgi:aryl-alcohol dehydrogenase-like predicted oxidoreductase
MEYRKLGESGLTVSALCLGTLTFGDRTEENEAKRIVAAAAEAGANFIDTADQYAKGESERIAGKAIAANRQHWILATKVGNRMGPGLGEAGLSRRWMCKRSTTA